MIIRIFFRFVSFLLMSGSVVAAVLDAARSVAATAPVFTPFRDIVAATGWIDMAALQNEIVHRYGSDLWLVINSGILQPPIWLISGILALLLYILVYRTPDPYEMLSR